jgi:uncharacterized membrane protein YfcA
VIELVNRRMRAQLNELYTVPLIPLISLVLFFAAAYQSWSTPRTELALWVVFLSASISNIIGFAFSPLAGAILFHLNPDVVSVVQGLLVASVAQQLYCVWRLRSEIRSLEFLPYVFGSLVTLPFGIFLLIKSQASVFLPLLGLLLLAYGTFTAIKPTFQVRKRNPFIGRVLAGALGGITGGLAAFPGAFVAIWCQAQGFDKEHQRAIVQPFILISQVAAIAMLSVARPVGATSLEAMQYAAPAVLGAYVGLHIFKTLSTSSFNRIVGVALAAAGVLIAAKSLQPTASPAAPVSAPQDNKSFQPMLR